MSSASLRQEERAITFLEDVLSPGFLSFPHEIKNLNVQLQGPDSIN